MTDLDLDRLLTEAGDPSPEALDAWTPLAPPPGFTDRVLAARAPRRPLRWALAAAAGLALGLLWLQPSLPAEGAITAESRRSLTLGARAAGVAEPGAALRWRSGWRDHVVVEQTAGSVFYRVRPGTPFEVQTPAGRVTATGTCFRVEVESMNVKSAVGGAAAGAALTAALFVTVFEGSVTVARAGQGTPVTPGQRVRVDADGVHRAQAEPPRETQVTALEAERDALQAEVDRLTRTAEGEPLAAAAASALRRNNRALEAKVAELTEALEQESVLRKESEGEPLTFPQDYPEAFREDALRAAFGAALEEAGIDGDVDAIDCSEFPCIVYGNGVVAGDDRQPLDAAFKRFGQVLDARWPRGEHNNHTSIWGGSERDDEGLRQTNRFGMVIYPKAYGDGSDPAMRKRLRFRQQQYIESVMQQHR